METIQRTKQAPCAVLPLVDPDPRGIDLDRLDREIEQSPDPFRRAACLLEIFERELWRASHPSFAGYCRGRWQIHPSHVHKRLDAVRVARDIPGAEGFGDSLPALAILAKIPDFLRPLIWAEAVRSTDGRPGPFDVQRIAKAHVDGWKQAGQMAEDPEPDWLDRPRAEAGLIRDRMRSLLDLAGILDDDEWLETLPLNGQLEGAQRDRFRRDALLYKASAELRRAFADAFRLLMSEEVGSADRGQWSRRVLAAIDAGHPAAWRLCPRGCAAKIGGRDCECDGAGYIAARSFDADGHEKRAGSAQSRKEAPGCP